MFCRLQILCVCHTLENNVCLFVSKISLPTFSPHPEHSVLIVLYESVESKFLDDDPCKLTMWDSAGKEAQTLCKLWLLQGGNTGKLIQSHWRWNETVSSLCTVLLDMEGQIMPNYFMSSLMWMEYQTTTAGMPQTKHFLTSFSYVLIVKWFESIDFRVR